MPLTPRHWMLHRLRGRLDKAERRKDQALEALIQRDGALDERPRYDFQDPGVIGGMLDEIAALQRRIATLETPRHARAAPSFAPIRQAPPAAPPPLVPPPLVPPPLASRPIPVAAVTVLDPPPPRRPAAEPRLDQAFRVLRTELERAHAAGELSEETGLDVLRQALRAALATDAPPPLRGQPAPRWDGTWPDPRRPGCPVDEAQDGWHWVRAPDKPLVVLSWHALSACWGQGKRIPARQIVADGVGYYGPCLPPALASNT